MRNSTRVMGLVGVVLLAATAFVFLVGNRNAQPQLEGREPGSLYNPVHEDEDLPSGDRQLLARDATRPIYDPQFVAAAAAGWEDETLVIALEIDGDARTYPVSHLNRREIVNDHVGKTPVLVTW